MTNPTRKRDYRSIKADLLAEAQAVGVYAMGAVLDPTLELLINGFALELENVYEMVEDALSLNRRTLLRNIFNSPFLLRPAQTVVELSVKEGCTLGPGLRLSWESAKRGVLPEYSLIANSDFEPSCLEGAFYCYGENVFTLGSGDEDTMGNSHYVAPGCNESPCLLLCVSSAVKDFSSGSFSVFFQPNENGIKKIFQEDQAMRRFVNYLNSSIIMASDKEGIFGAESILDRRNNHSPVKNKPNLNRSPTEDSFFVQMAVDHYYAPLVFNFEAGKKLTPSKVPQVIVSAFEQDANMRNSKIMQDGSRWVKVKFPYLAASDPRDLFSDVCINACLAVGYQKNPRDRFNFTRDDYNDMLNTFEFGLADRAGRYCGNFGKWVVSLLEDHQGNQYHYVFDDEPHQDECWFTLEQNSDDVTLIIHVPLRMVADVGYFDFHTGIILGEAANSNRVDILASQPANALDYPEVDKVRLLAPARCGGDGFAEEQDGEDSLGRGQVPILDRQYARGSAWLRNSDKLNTLLDLKSYLRNFHSDIEKVRAESVTLERENRLVSGVCLFVLFSEECNLSSAERDALCLYAGLQLEARVPIGTWVEVKAATEGWV